MKCLSSAVLALHHGEKIDDLTEDDKVAMKKCMQKKLKQVARKAKATEYCQTFPHDPNELESTHPDLYAKLKIPGHLAA